MSHQSSSSAAVTLAALRASPLAAELDDAQCTRLAAAMTARTLADGETLVREGSADDHLYAIVDGALAVVRGAGNGAGVTLYTLARGDLVGELSFLDGAQRYASLVARGRTEVLSLARSALEDLIDADGWLVYRVMRAIARVVHDIQRRLSLQSTELSNYIYKQHGRY